MKSVNLTPLVLNKPPHATDESNKTSWGKMTLISLAILGLIAVCVGLIIPTKMQKIHLTSTITPKNNENIQVTNDFGQCGPAAATVGPSFVYVPNRIIGCDGPFTGGLFSPSANNLCDAANGWRICRGVADVKAQGMTTALCSSTPNKKFYATQQKGSGVHLCDGNGNNDVFGCSNGLGLATNLKPDCSPLGATGSNLFGHYTGSPPQWSCAACSSNGLDELLTVSHQLNGAAVYDGGVMCCKDQVICPAGQYAASGQCNPCPIGHYCANGVKTICPAGEFQPDPSMSTCKKAGCGKFVPAPGGIQEETCRAGTYSGPGASQCTPVKAGEFSGAGACAPEKCPEGQYQDCDGQTKCNLAPCGHYVSGTGQTTYQKCPAGQYQPQEGQKSCIDVPMGSYSGEGHCSPRQCIPGTYQPLPGQPTCQRADCGHKVPTPGATGQIPCGKGFFQPNSGQPTCLPIPDGQISILNACEVKCCAAGTHRTPDFTCVDAPCGWYVPAQCSMIALPCPPGEFTASGGQSGCIKAPLGSIPNADQCGTKKCEPGTYQPVVGGTECKKTQCGEFTKDPGSSAVTKCPSGMYQNEAGQTGCKDCPAGTANPDVGKCSCPDCLPGTFQPAVKQTSCIDSPCGSFVKNAGSTEATKCPPGEYQDQVAQTECIAAPAGKFAVGGTCNPETCPAGSFTPMPGLTKCTESPCGSVVPSAGLSGPTACGPGKYQPLVGQTMCLDAPSGSYTQGTGNCEETLCAPGYYQPLTGQTDCGPADCGHYVAIKGSSTQSACGAGRYQPDTAKTTCLNAPLGQYVPTKGSCQPTPCPAGAYTNCEGQSECIVAPCGSYVASSGSQAAVLCQPGTYQDLPGQDKCLDTNPGQFSGLGYCHEQPCDPGTYQDMPRRDKCIAARCGHFVSGEGHRTDTQCVSGSYQPKTGQVGCLRTSYGRAPNPGTCIEGTIAGGGIFYSGPSAMQWVDAKAWCANNGDQLAIIKSMAEHNQAVAVCRSPTKNCWLGGSDRHKEGVWLWLDGKNIDDSTSFSNWGTGEPNNAGNENCLMTWCTMGSCWNDKACTDKYEFVCERRV